METTLSKIKAKKPCESGWKTLLEGLNKTKADDEPLNYVTIFEIHGISDTSWCLDKVENKQKELRLFAVWCARRVKYLIPQNEQEIFDEVLDVVEKYANGFATDIELASASASAWDLASASRDSAWALAWASAWASASASAWAWDSASAWASASASASAIKEIEDYFVKEVLK